MIRLLIPVFILSCGLNAQNLDVAAIKLDGRVCFVYEKYTSSESYYFIDNYVSTKQGKFSLINNYSLANEVLDLCGDINGMLNFAIAQRYKSYELTESSLFRRKAMFNSGQHFGGEIYDVVNNENQLVISFKLSAFGIAIYSECPATDHPLLVKEKHCHFTNDRDDAALFLITNITNISPLSQKEVDRRGLKKSSIKSFSVIYCE